MATISRIRPHLPESFIAAAAPAPIAPAALLLVAMAAGGLGLTVLGRPPTAPEAPPPATVTETEAADLPRGDLPIIGDPIRDLTIWWSNRLTDASRLRILDVKGPSTASNSARILRVMIVCLALWPDLAGGR